MSLSAAPDPLTVPTWIGAIATVILALGAIITAIFAVLAWRNQSAEVSLQRKELERVAADRRRAQASRVFIWHDVKPGEDAVQIHAMGPDAQNLTIEQWPDSTLNTQIWLIVIHVRNTSEQPTYDLMLRWRTGSADWKGPEQWPFLEPDANEEHARYAAVPGTEPMNTEQLDAVLEFRDAAGVRWLRRIDGELQEQQAMINAPA